MFVALAVLSLSSHAQDRQLFNHLSAGISATGSIKIPSDARCLMQLNATGTLGSTTHKGTIELDLSELK